MKLMKGFLLGAVLVTAAGAYAGPTIYAAIPLGGCVDTSNTALSTTSEVVFAAYPGRKSVCVSNKSATIGVSIRRGATATTASPWIPPQGQWCDSPEGGYMWEGTIDAIADSGTPAIGGEQCR